MIVEIDAAVPPRIIAPNRSAGLDLVLINPFEAQT